MKKRLVQYGVSVMIMGVMIYVANRTEDANERHYYQREHIRSILALPAADWARFTLPGTGASVEMPVSPRERTETIANKGTVHFFDSRDRGMLFTVSYFDYPANTTERWSVDELLDASNDALLQLSDKTVRSQQKVDCEGWPGREVVVALREKIPSTTITRFFVVAERGYQFYVNSYDECLDEGLARRFFKSARFPPHCHGAGVDEKSAPPTSAMPD